MSIVLIHPYIWTCILYPFYWFPIIIIINPIVDPIPIDRTNIICVNLKLKICEFPKNHKKNINTNKPTSAKTVERILISPFSFTNNWDRYMFSWAKMNQHDDWIVSLSNVKWNKKIIQSSWRLVLQKVSFYFIIYKLNVTKKLNFFLYFFFLGPNNCSAERKR